MAFRIRGTDCGSPEYWETQDKIYRDHLIKFNKRNNSDLWKFFYWDFFHDGCIEKVSFWDTSGNITLHMSCPSIKKKVGDSFTYISGSYQATVNNNDTFYSSTVIQPSKSGK